MGDTEAVFNEHKPILEKDYHLDLSSYSFKPLEELFEEGQKKVDSSETKLSRALAKRDLKKLVSDHKKTLMMINMDDRVIRVNLGKLNECSELDGGEDYPEFGMFHYISCLTYSVIHECFHTIVPVIDKVGLYSTTMKDPTSYEPTLKNLWRAAREAVAARRRDVVEEAVANFYTNLYLKKHCDKEFDELKADMAGKGYEFSKENLPVDEELRLRMISIIHLESFVDAMDLICREKNKQSIPYKNLKELFEANGLDGVVAGIRDPNSLLKR
ncbi:hypothetical protein HY643_00300 [Candidatus Woesearchaeota archaeon]|nr:hypothetical protein [Candidatus Woesearchaeota archaeon]